MNHPYSPSASTPPPLPTDYNRKPLSVPKRKGLLVLSTSRAAPFRKASAVIGIFSVVVCLLTCKVGWGLNLPFIAAAALSVGFWKRPDLLQHTSIRVQLGVWLALSIAVIFHFDPWTIMPFVFVFLTLVGSLLFGRAVDPLRGVARTLVQVVAIPWAYVKAIRFGRASISPKEGAISTVFRLIAFPLFIAVGFGTLYVWSNRSLSEWSFNFFDKILSGSWLVNSLQIGWSLFISSLVGAALVYGMKNQDGRLLRSIGSRPTMLLESVSTWSSVSVALVLVNILALVLNTVDGTTTWIGEVSTSVAELKRGVHAGTYTLISAIVLAASYLLYHFRVPPKDYERARGLAVVWLGQNLMMAITVALRNYHYTDAYGLTIKRIGVWLFFCCTVTGVYFLGKQVRYNGSIEELVRRQAWAVYLVLATAALPNWPGLITRYNHQEARMVLDEAYLNRLLPHNIDVWAEYNIDKLKKVSSEYIAHSDGWFEASHDLREWDYSSARRAALIKALHTKPHTDLKAKKAESSLRPEVEENVNFIDYDREVLPEPNPDSEAINSYN